MGSTPEPARSRKRYALFVGRWQPFHEGHQWLIEQKLGQGIPCLIAIRDTERDEQNPYNADEVQSMIRTHYNKRMVEGDLPAQVTVIVIPDIESVNYGRGVGYEVNEHVPPPDIHEISATKIRAGL